MRESNLESAIAGMSASSALDENTTSGTCRPIRPRPALRALPLWPDIAGGASGRGDVALQRVIHHHAIGVEAPAQGADGTLHAPDPATRKAVTVALVEQGNHLVVQGAVEILAITGVMHAHVGVSAAIADGEAIHAVVGLGPPSVKHGKIEPAIEHYLLPAGAGSLEWPAWIIQPDVHALYQVASHVDVVIFDEH